MSEDLLTIESLSKSFLGRRAVDDFSLTVRQGEWVSIIGRNGAGKTTLFNCMGGLIDFEGGSIRLLVRGDEQQLRPGDHSIKAAIRQRIGIVFQDEALWPHLTIAQ